ncbi:MAG: rRNA cytosine-C5-methyltransferase [Bacteroidales bacterium]|jgi:16S rRNA (cytosine1407-C5)-methyltransferase|nr:rRNA cytosine-C5-methyltransferase [Bacteroidales bacterium]
MYPVKFVNSLKTHFGEKRACRLLSALDSEPSLSVRANPVKITAEELANHFSDIFDGHVPWCREGLYLRSRPSFTLDPLFHAGYYYVQEASSMYIGVLLEKAMRQLSDGTLYDYSGFCDSADRPGLRILDLCAAPGGKSTHILSTIAPNDLLLSNEVIRSRASILAENVAKWGYSNVVVSNNDPADFSALNDFFDIVLVDAPCSGEGMFRKDPDAVNAWSVDNVRLCASRQRRIVSAIWPALRSGGFMIYSTCTFNTLENEENVAWMVSELGSELIEQHRFLPGEERGEGFFIAILRKNGDHSPFVNSVKISRNQKSQIPSCTSFISQVDGQFLFSLKGDLWRVFPMALAADIRLLESSLRVIRSGVAVAVQKGRDMVPEADLALSPVLNKEAFPMVELSLEDVLKYLAKENIVFGSEVPSGYLLVSYKGAPLGFVKNLGHRSNNLYPLSRRIKGALEPL